MDALVSGTEAKATIGKESARPWDGSCAGSAWPLLGVFYLTTGNGSHALLRGWRGSKNAHMHARAHTHPHFPLSCHQLAMEQEVRSAGWDRSVQEGTAPRPPARCCLTQPGRKTWKSHTFGLIKPSCPCFFLAVSISESWSIWRRPAFNCPLSTHCDGTGGSSHTIRQTSDGTDGCPRAVTVPVTSGAGRQARAGDLHELGAHRCPELSPAQRAETETPGSSDTPANGFLPSEGQVTPKAATSP